MIQYGPLPGCREPSETDWACDVYDYSMLFINVTLTVSILYMLLYMACAQRCSGGGSSVAFYRPEYPAIENANDSDSDFDTATHNS